MKKLGILFDQDGTLADSGPGIIRCAKLALNHYGIDREDKDLRVFVGPPLRDSFLNFGIEEKEVANAIEIYRNEYKDKGIFENSLYPGILSMLKQLKEDGHHLYVVTSKPKPMAEKVVEHYGMSPYFDKLYGTSIDKLIAETKSDLIHRAIEENKDLVSGFLMVGDTKFDILGAKGNKIRSVAVLYGYGSEESIDRAGPDFKVNNPSELLHLIEFLESDCEND